MIRLAPKNAGAPLSLEPAATDRIAWVYHARGLAIMLIAYRHIVLGMQAAGVAVTEVMYNMQIVFYNFRMPAFFILSGVFIARSLKKRSRKKVAWSKVSNLLYPYLLWSVITLVLQLGFNRYSNAHRTWKSFANIIIQPRALDQLWYLLALFNLSMLYLLLSRLPKRYTWVHLSIAMVLHYVSFYIKSYSLFSDFFFFYIYFAVGAVVSDLLLSAEMRKKIFKPSYLLVILPLFLLGQWFWYDQIGKLFWETKERIQLTNTQIGFVEILFLLNNFLGCYVLFRASMFIARTHRNDWLAYIGRYSLYVYILHVQMAAIVRKVVYGAYPNVDPWLLLGICYVSGIVLPILIINGFRKWGIERLFTLQKKSEA